MAFDPDAYIKKKAFDPDAYLQIKGGDLTPGTVQQEAGETVTKKYLKNVGKGALKGALIQDLSEEDRQTPGVELGQMAGSFVPMAVAEAIVPGGPAVKPLLKTAMAGLTYGAAKGAVNQTPITETMGSMAADAAAFMGGHGIARVAGKALAPFSGSVSQATKQAAETAAKEGIDLPLGNRTDSKMLQVVERGLEYTPFGGYITRQRDAALNNFRGMVERIGNKISVGRPPEVAGNLAKEATIAYKEAFDQTKTKLYESVMPILKNRPVTVDETVKTLEGIIERRSGDLEPAGLGKLRKLYERLKPRETEVGTSRGSYVPATSEVPSVAQSESGVPRLVPPRKEVVKPGNPYLLTPDEINPESVPGYTTGFGGYQPAKEAIPSKPGRWMGDPGGQLTVPTHMKGMASAGPEAGIKEFGQLKNERTNLGQMIKTFGDPGATGLQSDLKSLYAAMSNDLDNAASAVSPEIKAGIEKANEFYGQGIKTLKSKLYRGLQAVSPENVHKIVIVPDAPSVAEAGKEILGDNFKDVARQWFDSMVQKATVDGVVSPQRLSTALKKYGSTIDVVAEGNPALQEGFQKLRQVSSAMAKAGTTQGGSQTAYNINALGNIAYITTMIGQAFYNPSLAGKMAAGLGVEYAAARGIASEAGKKYLSEGFPVAARKVQGAVALPAKASLTAILEKLRK